MDELMTKFGAGTVPHFFVVETLGKLASENGTLSLWFQIQLQIYIFIFFVVYGVVPRVKDALTRMLPVMAGIKHDNLKWAFCSCESSINHFLFIYLFIYLLIY